MNVLLFGAEADELRRDVAPHASLHVVEEAPDVVVCYGGDGTLLSAERQWPGVPKAPIRNSRRGNRCMPHPPADVLARLAEDALVRTEYMKLACAIHHAGRPDPPVSLTAMNEFNGHMGRINAAVRFTLWIDDEPYGGGREILGDGFVVSTPFGSTAYFSQITRGVFHAGIGVAFQNTSEHTNHLVLPEDAVVRLAITRGPATLAWDNAPDYVPLEEGHELVVRKHPEPAVLLTSHAMSHPSDDF